MYLVCIIYLLFMSRHNSKFIVLTFTLLQKSFGRKDNTFGAVWRPLQVVYHLFDRQVYGLTALLGMICSLAALYICIYFYIYVFMYNVQFLRNAIFVLSAWNIIVRSCAIVWGVGIAECLCSFCYLRHWAALITVFFLCGSNTMCFVSKHRVR